MANKVRTPRHPFQRLCDYCNKPYTAFRKSSKYCCHAHGTFAWQEKNDTLRSEVLAKFENKCSVCGNATGRIFIRTLPGQEKKIENFRTYCGKCNSTLSQVLFHQRVKEATPGRTYRLNIEKKMLREGTFSGDVVTRFWSKVDASRGQDACWPWQGTCAAGYGQFYTGGEGRRGGKCRAAHRVSWELTHGAIPPGLLVCHTCDYPPCVNPKHLFLGTREDNSKDMSRKGRGYFNRRARAFRVLKQIDN